MKTFFVLLTLFFSTFSQATWDDIREDLDNWPLLNKVNFLVGNSTHILFQHSKGDTDFDDTLVMMSATKIVAGVIIMKLVEEGVMDLYATPAEYVDYWTTDPSDPRHNVTIQNLLSFTSGWNGPDCPCIFQNRDHEGCAQTCYETGNHQWAAGSTFDYNSNHLHILSGVAAAAAGKSFKELSEEILFRPLGMDTCFWTNPENPQPASGLQCSTNDYHKFLVSFFNKEILRPDTVDLMEQDFTPLETVDIDNAFGHYSLANWFECPVNWRDVCLEQNIHGSIGINGFYPYWDRQHSFYMIIGTDSSLIGSGSFRFLRKSQIIEAVTGQVASEKYEMTRNQVMDFLRAVIERETN